MKKTQISGPSQRQLRVAEEIRHVLARMLSQDDLFIEGLKASYLMITEVRISPDLTYASVFVRAMSPVDTQEQVDLLNAHKGPFRYRVGKSIRLRLVPELVFKPDLSFDEVTHIADLLNSPTVQADVRQAAERDESDDA